MTLIVAARRGNEIACISDMMASASPTPGKEARFVGPAMRTAGSLPPELRYQAQLQRKAFRIADQAYVLLAGGADSALEFVKTLRARCEGTSLSHAGFAKACEESADGRVGISYFAISQLDGEPKIHGWSPKLQTHSHDGIEFLFDGSGANDFRLYFEYITKQFPMEHTGPHPWDFLSAFGALSQGLQYLFGVGLKDRWGSAFEYLNNRSGSLTFEDNILSYVGRAFRNIDGSINTLVPDWLSYQFYRDNYVVIFSEPAGDERAIWIAREHPEDRNLRQNNPGEQYTVERLNSILAGFKFDMLAVSAIIYQTGIWRLTDPKSQVKRLSAETQSMSDLGFPLALNSDPTGGRFLSDLRDVSVWVPRLDRAAAFLGI